MCWAWACHSSVSFFFYKEWFCCLERDDRKFEEKINNLAYRGAIIAFQFPPRKTNEWQWGGDSSGRSRQRPNLLPYIQLVPHPGGVLHVGDRGGYHGAAYPGLDTGELKPGNKKEFNCWGYNKMYRNLIEYIFQNTNLLLTRVILHYYNLK